MDEEDEQFYYAEDLETFDAETETGITQSREAIDDFINQQKSANTNKKTATDTLLRCMEVNGMKNEKIESLPASELDFLLPIFFWKHTEKRRRIKLRASKSFQKFRSHGGPVEMNAPESPFYLVDRHYGRSNEEIFDIWRYPSEKMK